MEDPIRDDVAALLDGELGDDRILRQILRAYDNGEVISNFERGYVKKLAERHLGRGAPQDAPAPAQAPAPPAGAPAEAPGTAAGPRTAALQRLQAPPAPRRGRSGIAGRLRSKKAAVIAGAVVVALAAAAASSGGGGGDPGPLTVETDLRSYSAGDIISISGSSRDGGPVELSIAGPGGGTAWSERVPVRDDGTYSTLAIAGGPGWEEQGAYVLEAGGGGATEETRFAFNP